MLVSNIFKMKNRGLKESTELESVEVEVNLGAGGGVNMIRVHLMKFSKK